jgi:hypothetical protein
MTVSSSLIASAAWLYRLDDGIGRGNALFETDGMAGFLLATRSRRLMRQGIDRRMEATIMVDLAANGRW